MPMMIKGTTNRASLAAFVLLALGCGGRTEIQASAGGSGSSGAPSGVIVNGVPPSGGQGGSGDTAGTGSGTAGAASGGTAGVGGSAGSSCAGVTCTTPPASLCKTTATATTYSAAGTCSGAGVCSYTPTDIGCGTNKACAGAGVCSVCKADASCGAACAACGTGTPKCKNLGTTSQCVGCLSDRDCSGTTPSCNTTTNVCGPPPPPSCIGLAATCGPSGNASCCASSVVTGGTFNRGNDANYPATVSDFRLDTYEITVGRFRKFWSSYPGNMPAAGSGKNPNDASDPGWDGAWNTSSLPASQAALTTSTTCEYKRSSNVTDRQYRSTQPFRSPTASWWRVGALRQFTESSRSNLRASFGPPRAALAICSAAASASLPASACSPTESLATDRVARRTWATTSSERGERSDLLLT